MPANWESAMLGVVVVWVGLIAAFGGAISLLKPLSFLGIRTRGRAVVIFGLGLMVAVIGQSLPPNEMRVATPRTRLDEFTPVYQFSEFHSLRIAAPKEQVYRAIKSVKADEILFFRTLVWIRRFGRPGPESILNAPEHKPLLDVATQTTFLLLAEEPNHEILVGTVVHAPRGWKRSDLRTPERFKGLHEPGFALATMNYLIDDAGPTACMLTTETRVYATDPSSRRTFARYWRVIYPGSALIRRMWLRAVSRRVSTGPGA